MTTRTDDERGASPNDREVWIWVPAGSHAPSMVQAAAEVRDALDPARARGRVGFLLDGPLVDDAGARAREQRRAFAGARAVLALVEGPHEEARRIELDPADDAARRAARATGVPLLVSAPTPAGPLGAPLLVYRHGEGSRRFPEVTREVAEPARQAIESLLAALGVSEGRRARPPLRVLVKQRSTVDSGELGGAVETTVRPGAVVRAGALLGLVGPAGLGRQPIVAPSSGVVLSIDRSPGGPRFVLGRLERTLARAEHLLGAPTGARAVIGWCEWVALPDLGAPRIKAKVDTGAKSCALHVVSLDPPGGPAGKVIEIEIPSDVPGATTRARARVVGHATVRDSGGHVERRPVIRTTLALGGIARRVLVTLTDRGDMLFPMLIGRTAVPGTLLVDPGARFRLGRR